METEAESDGETKKRCKTKMMPMFLLSVDCRSFFLSCGFCLSSRFTSTPQDTEAVTHKYTQPSGSAASSPLLKHQLRGELASLNASFSCQTNLSHKLQIICDTGLSRLQSGLLTGIWRQFKVNFMSSKVFKSKSSHRSSLCS